MLSQKISGTKIRRLRERQCLKVADVAEAAGCSRWHIYKIEQGSAQPSPQLYAALKATFKAEDNDLVETPAESAV
ncbi:helix-turn-helix transcriptional regulator [Streptomyces solisilvae]|uniref:helix-turn-helix transcriptional regulator n=1 Tax=Streptomyces malaysiensis TaxID=92644 RepID=UPI0033231C79